MTEPGYLSGHTAVSGNSYVQTSPDIQATNGEESIRAGQLMSINPSDGKAYLCGLASVNCVPAGFAASDNPLGTTVDDTRKITLLRQGRLRGFSGLIPGALYYPSAVTPGAIVPEQGTAGAVITAITANNGSGFLRNVHVRAGQRPMEGDWTITFPTATTVTITSPDGVVSASSTVADATAYNGSLAGAGDFYIETASLTAGDVATVTVSYSTEAAAVLTLDSPGTAFTAISPIAGIAGRRCPEAIAKLVTTATTATVGYNGVSQSAPRTIAAGSSCFDIIPGVVLTTEAGTVTAETNYVMLSAQRPAAPVGIAVSEGTLQIFMGGNC